MKTKFLIAILFIILAIAYCSKAATVVVKISQFPNTTAPANSDLFLLASGSTNKNITWSQLKDAIGTNPATVTILNNLYVSNVYATNISVTNLTVLNEFHGKTTITTNLYVDYVTNNISYITNLFLTELTTNYFLFTTNIYQSYPTYVNNTYVSNYFQTNAFNNTYVSNYFHTNQYLYYTNIYHYTTNLTVTNFYLTDQYISNFFNTNIFFVDNTVSNFFATNIYNTINISSNYTYQYDMNLTNPVFYGHAFLDGYAGNPFPVFRVLSPYGYDIWMDGETGDINASGMNVDTYRTLDWDWEGPTNTLELWTSDQFYRATSDCQITNLSQFPPFGYNWGGLLTITNAAATNIVLRFPSTIVIPERTNAVVISNASVGMLSLKWHRRASTNGVYRQF